MFLSVMYMSSRCACVCVNSCRALEREACFPARLSRLIGCGWFRRRWHHQTSSWPTLVWHQTHKHTHLLSSVCSLNCSWISWNSTDVFKFSPAVSNRMRFWKSLQIRLSVCERTTLQMLSLTHTHCYCHARLHPDRQRKHNMINFSNTDNHWEITEMAIW